MSDEIKKQSWDKGPYPVLIGLLIAAAIILAEEFELTLLGNVVCAVFGASMLFVGLWHSFLFFVDGFFRVRSILKKEKVERAHFANHLSLFYCLVYGLLLTCAGAYILYLVFTGQAFTG
ncbi:MAG: hypothetical protein JKY71_07635 [Alphaproteobacteria bacterium]|nr:hypothetical protein [Alphaproteobacteria bacterium]